MSENMNKPTIFHFRKEEKLYISYSSEYEGCCKNQFSISTQFSSI